MTIKPKVIVLTTGGTIGHRSGADGVAVMDFDPRALATSIGVSDIDLEFKAIFQKGSMDIAPDDWVAIATAAADTIAQAPRGIVILHGTDTMHYTAAALSFMLRGLGLPVVLTGSMIPGGDAGSDSIPNLRDAIRLAAHTDLAEVCIVFSADVERTKGLIIRGNRARKIHSHAIDAFGSINAPPLGSIAGETITLTQANVRRRTDSALQLTTGLDQNVVLIKLHPGLTPDMLAQQFGGASGAVLEGTGVGHIKTDLQSVIADFGRPVLVSTQTVHGGERLGLYAVDQHILAIPNVIPGADMTSETALVKLMWVLAQGVDVRTLMRTNVAGEISTA